VVFYEITKDDVKEAIKNPRGIDENLRKSPGSQKLSTDLLAMIFQDLSGKKSDMGFLPDAYNPQHLEYSWNAKEKSARIIPEKFWVLLQKRSKWKRFNFFCL
jgi:DNA topoisomerase-1